MGAAEGKLSWDWPIHFLSQVASDEDLLLTGKVTGLLCACSVSPAEKSSPVAMQGKSLLWTQTLFVHGVVLTRQVSFPVTTSTEKSLLWFQSRFPASFSGLNFSLFVPKSCINVTLVEPDFRH